METDEYRKMFELEENFWWYRGMRRITERILDRHFPEAAAVSILDAGCGTGGMLKALRPYSRMLPIGLDISTEAIKYLKWRGEPLVLRASVTQVPFRVASFDLITCFDVLYQLSPGEDRFAFNEFYRVLKPGGKIYVRLPAYQWMAGAHDRFVKTAHRYTRTELIAGLQNAKFRVLQASYANFFLFPFLASKRLVLEKFGLLVNSSDLRPMPRFIDRLLEVPLWIESLFLSKISFSFPWGLSVICLAEKE